MRRILWIAGALLAASCEFEDHTEIATAEIGCGPNCLGNSPIAGALGPYEFDLTGVEPSSRKWKLYPRSFEKLGWPLTNVQVAGARLTATWWPGGFVANSPQFIQDWQLIDTTFRMHHETDGDFEFKIATATPVTYYPNAAVAMDLPPMWAYYILYRDVKNARDEFRRLCPYTDAFDSGLSGDWAVFWRGDRYRPDTGKIIASGTGAGGVGNWVNLSCAGEATIKMLRSAVGEAVAPDSERTLRQSVFNMFMAQFCPNSTKRYTVLGQDLFWEGTPHTVTGVGVAEAIWNEDGAICLDTQRTYEAGDAKADCGLPSCARMLPGWQGHGKLYSFTP